MSEILLGFTDTLKTMYTLLNQTTSDEKSPDLQVFPHESLDGEREGGRVEKDLPAVTWK